MAIHLLVKARAKGYALVLAAMVSAAWAFAAGFHAMAGAHRLFHLLELARNLVWFFFLVMLLKLVVKDLYFTRVFRQMLMIVAAIFIALFALDIYLQYESSFWLKISIHDVWAYEYILQAVAAIILLEQVLKNANEKQRWAIKFYFIGLGVIFCYDLFLYSEALLYKRLNEDFWSARGVVNALAVPLLLIAFRRSALLEKEIIVSRKVVFHSASLIGVGIYLLLISGLGYFLYFYSGEVGSVVQAAFLAGALILLLVLMFSDQVRARMRVLINKHLYAYRYDYREEWLRFMSNFSAAADDTDLGERVISAIANIIDSPGGALWLLDEHGGYLLAARVNMPDVLEETIPEHHPLPAFLKAHHWVVDLRALQAGAEEYAGIVVPEKMQAARLARIILPLLHQDALQGFILLKQPRAEIEFDWEERDLLKTVGRQAAGYLALMRASQSLFEARQFEAFNRLSAYIVHDLKNVVAQLSLVISNSARHKHKPEFIDDAFATIENAVGRMNKLLAQLRKNRGELASPVERVHLPRLLESLVRQREGQLPAPALGGSPGEDVYVLADKTRLLAVLEHIVQNAQEATPPDGAVTITLGGREGYAEVLISDTGCGMDPEFIRTRLFKPFDTTKGNAGMGIGVYEAREYIHGLGGRLTVKSAVGQGTEFSIDIPKVVIDGAMIGQA